MNLLLLVSIHRLSAKHLTSEFNPTSGAANLKLNSPSLIGLNSILIDMLLMLKDKYFN